MRERVCREGPGLPIQARSNEPVDPVQLSDATRYPGGLNLASAPVALKQEASQLLRLTSKLISRSKQPRRASAYGSGLVGDWRRAGASIPPYRICVLASEHDRCVNVALRCRTAACFAAVFGMHL